MAKRTRQETEPPIDPRALHRAARRGERRLLAAEWDAERRLDVARAKLARAQARLAKRQTRLAEAEELLRQRQSARAAGPSTDAEPA
ncbi:MAG: hypothetical protein H0W06_05170 [Chloroflexia bacterium]|nr:hypothetical protein [Chloroflexia bacterium]